MLRWLFGSRDVAVSKPNHDFFKTERWTCVGGSSSHYHFPHVCNVTYSPSYLPGELFIFSRSDLKNYGSEIESFIDWASPYLLNEPGDWVGHVFYEEWVAPIPWFAGVPLDFKAARTFD